MSLRSFPKRLTTKGFSLIELLVVVLIIISLTLVVATKYPDAIQSYTLSSAAQNVALLIRQAQQYDVSVKEGTGARYGVYVDTYAKTFQLFIDGQAGGAGSRTHGSGDTDVPPILSLADPSIASVSVIITQTSGVTSSPANFSILFDRPSLTPLVRDESGGTLYPAVRSVRIVITGAAGSVANVDISPVGTVITS
jgi:prepilin-type N-terminal cleavage/methylation domain-containing protein